jgi:hypothetical protein
MQTIIVYEQVPDSTRIFAVPNTNPEDDAKLRLINHSLVNVTNLTEEQASAHEWLYALISDDGAWKKYELPYTLRVEESSEGPPGHVLDGPFQMFRAGFHL